MYLLISGKTLGDTEVLMETRNQGLEILFTCYNEQIIGSTKFV